MKNQLHTEDIEQIKRGTVVLVRLDPTQGAEIQKTRPCLVVQADNFKQRTLLVVPISSIEGKTTSLGQPRRPFTSEVLLQKGEAGLPKESVAIALQLRCIDKLERIEKVLGCISEARMKEVEKKLLLALGMVEGIP